MFADFAALLRSATCEKIEHARQHGVGKKCRIVAKLRLVPLSRICSMAESGMPALPDIVIASDEATRATAQSMLLVVS
jgi:hypothetical protein